MSKTTIPTGGITADAINATLIADDAISEEHLDATAITGHTALAEAPADTDEFLISDGGTLKRIDASYVGGSPGLVHMATTEISSNTADVTFISGTGGVDFNSGTYENFLIIVNGATIVDDDDSFRISVSIDGGSNYVAQLYMAQDTVEMTQSGSSGSAGQVGQSSAGAIAMLDSVGSNLGNAFQFHIWCYDFNSTTQKKYMHIEALMEQHNSIYKKRSSLIHIVERTDAVDGIRFNCNSGNVAKGKFRVYGINKG